jgi:hypothetical protein
VRVPFTHEQARSALNRVIRKAAPSGENNEQFRDCCIWDAALSAALDRSVHLVIKKDIRIYPALKDFLTAMGDRISSIDEETIGVAIVQSVAGRAYEIATDKGTFELGAPHKPKISGYATPKPSLIAISFEVVFDLTFAEVRGETEDRDEVELALKGVCSYDPSNKQFSEIEVREWSMYLKGAGAWSTHLPDRIAIERQYGPPRMRIIS